jgi:tetratricopeptide (TPR) repeat protein
MDPRPQNYKHEDWKQAISACWDKIEEIEATDPQSQHQKTQIILAHHLKNINDLLSHYYNDKLIEARVLNGTYVISQVERAMNLSKKLDAESNLKLSNDLLVLLLDVQSDECTILLEKKEFKKTIEISQASLNFLDQLISEFKELCPSTWRMLEGLKIGCVGDYVHRLQKFAVNLFDEEKLLEAVEYFQISRDQSKLILTLAEQAQKAGFNYLPHIVEEIAEATDTLNESHFGLANSYGLYADIIPDYNNSTTKYFRAAIEEMELVQLTPEFLKRSKHRTPQTINMHLAEWRYGLGTSLSWQGKAFYENGNLAEAAKYRQAAVDVIMKVPSEFFKKGSWWISMSAQKFQLMDFQIELCETLNELADSLVVKKEYQEAIRNYQAAIDLLNIMSTSPENKISNLGQLKSLHEKIAGILPLWIAQIKENPKDKRKDSSESEVMETLKKDAPTIWKKMKATEEKSKIASTKKFQAPVKPRKNKAALTENEREQKQQSHETARSPTMRRRRK